MRSSSSHRKSHRRCHPGRYWTGVVVCALLVMLAVYVLAVRPSNERDWQAEQRLQASAVVEGELVHFLNLRDQRYTSEGPVSLSHYNQTFNVSDLRSLDLFVADIAAWKAIAHTFFLFTFANGSELTVSVEARREKDETYSAASGVLRVYEVFYVWSAPSDNLDRRLVWQRPPLSKYRIDTDQPTLEALFLTLVQDTNDLRAHPRFYNTLYSTCTSNLLDAAREVSQIDLPFTMARVLPGYAPGYLYDLGLIETNSTRDELVQAHRMN